MRTLAFASILLCSLALAHPASADACADWFKQSKVKPGPDCLIECASSGVDLGTMNCHDACPSLCKTTNAIDFTFQISALYPALTVEERALAALHPADALKVYKAKADTEKLCEKKFGDNRTGDRSDACRHFVWAALLVSELGSDRANEFLNAHEQAPGQLVTEKSMDLANNRAGALAALKLSKSGKLTIDKIAKELDQAFKRNELIVLSGESK